MQFAHAHATHPDWRMALSLVLTQLDAQRSSGRHAKQASLGLVYFTEAYVPAADALLAELRTRTGVPHWAGCSTVAVAASGVEYVDEPALAVMLCDLPEAAVRVFSGVAPLARGVAHTALVHGDGATPDVDELIEELAQRTATGYCFGGLASGRTHTVSIADGVHRGGISGVAFSDAVPLLSRVTQGCQPVGAARSITRAEGNVVYALDGQPALPLLYQDMRIDTRDPREAVLRLRGVMVGLSRAGHDATARPGQFGADTVIRHLVGIDPQAQGLAIADLPQPGMRLAFSTRDRDAARRDLIRICAEIREELAPHEVEAPVTANAGTGDAPPAHRAIRGALFVSCTGRGGPHFGAPNAELKLVQQYLGDVPLVGFYAAGEIARGNLYGYTAVLTVFTG
ncbi:MAG: FIST C-terminal domain-containing protein [Betaproteobacteria bacterium]|nr:FIST C-terminal domain-containing protein [Betaproteobacteria bacterium]